MLRVQGGESPLAVDVPEIERVIARMARIPEKQATLSEKERLRSLEESLARVVFGQEDAVRTVAQSIKRETVWRSEYSLMS